MNLRTLLLLLFTLLYFVLGHWFYTNKISGICNNKVSTTTTTTVPAVPDDDEEITNADSDDLVTMPAGSVGPLSFNWSDEIPTTTNDFENYKNSVLREFSDENVLEVTGYYYADEETPAGYENMGFARAEQIRDLFKDVVPKDRIIVNSKLIEDKENMEFDPFEAAEFNWIPRIKSGETTIAEIDDRTLIFFPFNSSIKEGNPTVDNYLDALAERLKSTGDRVRIIGHTDSTGGAKFNHTLGLDRAVAIKNILKRKGVQGSKILVMSKGETQPIASNRTSEGEHKNRRVELQMIYEK